jgi:hypothetical protein
MSLKKYNKPHILDNGTLIYPKRGWEPPPLVEGYQRKSNNPKNSDAWVLIPIWTTCCFRSRVQIPKEGCRCVTFYHICTNKEIGKDVIVNLNLCSSCKFCKSNA